jgi:tetratricopeptide (TPR) repeat protein
MLKRLIPLALLTVVAGKAEAQAGNQIVIAAQPSTYEAPTCEQFKGGHFKVKSAATYLQSALSSPENRVRILGDANRVLLEAITQDHQDGNPGAWYWLGRIDLNQGDMAGADSALAKAQQLAPNCTDDLRKTRLPTYSALIRPVADLMQSGNEDSALVLLKQAASFYPDGPYAFQNMGIIYYNKKQLDSAAANFEKAAAAADARAATDTAYASLRAQATFNLAAVYQNAGRHKEAVDALRRYLTWNPTDNDARRALANSFRAAGMVDSAKAIESQLLSSAAAPGGGVGAGVDVFDLGVKAFNDKNYTDAAKAFHQALQEDPMYRDALFNLANTYVLMAGDSAASAAQRASATDSLIAVGERLIAVDPINEHNLRLLARGYQIKKNQDKTLMYVTRLDSLPVNIDVTSFQRAPGSATLVGAATGRAAKDISTDRPIAPVALTLVFEFVDKTGNVVGTQEVAVNPLAEGAKQDLTVSAQGQGIIAWRYHRK